MVAVEIGDDTESDGTRRAAGGVALVFEELDGGGEFGDGGVEILFGEWDRHVAPFQHGGEGFGEARSLRGGWEDFSHV